MSESENLAHVCFKDVAWLQSFELSIESVLDYFAMSQFYDRTCNNEVLKMQARFTDNSALLSQLHNMTGIEYAVMKCTPPRLFVIACYYILDGSIFMAPNLYDLMSTRLTTSMFYLQEAINYAANHIKYNVSSGTFTTQSTDDTNYVANIMGKEDELFYKEILDEIMK